MQDIWNKSSGILSGLETHNKGNAEQRNDSTVSSIDKKKTAKGRRL